MNNIKLTLYFLAIYQILFQNILIHSLKEEGNDTPQCKSLSLSSKSSFWRIPENNTTKLAKTLFNKAKVITELLLDLLKSNVKENQVFSKCGGSIDIMKGLPLFLR